MQWVVILIIWALVSTAVKSRQKQQKAQQQAARQQAPRMPAAPAQPAPQPAPQPPVRSAFSQPSSSVMSRQDTWDDEEENWDERDAVRGGGFAGGTGRHESKPFEAHMHTPVMGEQGVGTEGVDCCHEFMLNETPASETADFLPMQEDNAQEKAKALLQGVIFSEVLGRRHARRFGGRHA